MWNEAFHREMRMEKANSIRSLWKNSEMAWWSMGQVSPVRSTQEGTRAAVCTHTGCSARLPAPPLCGCSLSFCDQGSTRLWSTSVPGLSGFIWKWPECHPVASVPLISVFPLPTPEALPRASVWGFPLSQSLWSLGIILTPLLLTPYIQCVNSVHITFQVYLEPTHCLWPAATPLLEPPPSLLLQGCVGFWCPTFPAPPPSPQPCLPSPPPSSVRSRSSSQNGPVKGKAKAPHAFLHWEPSSGFLPPLEWGFKPFRGPSSSAFSIMPSDLGPTTGHSLALSVSWTGLLTCHSSNRWFPQHFPELLTPLREQLPSLGGFQGPTGWGSLLPILIFFPVAGFPVCSARACALLHLFCLHCPALLYFFRRLFLLEMVLFLDWLPHISAFLHYAVISVTAGPSASWCCPSTCSSARHTACAQQVPLCMTTGSPRWSAMFPREMLIEKLGHRSGKP